MHYSTFLAQTLSLHGKKTFSSRYLLFYALNVKNTQIADLSWLNVKISKIHVTFKKSPYIAGICRISDHMSSKSRKYWSFMAKSIFSSKSLINPLPNVTAPIIAHILWWRYNLWKLCLKTPWRAKEKIKTRMCIYLWLKPFKGGYSWSRRVVNISIFN